MTSLETLWAGGAPSPAAIEVLTELNVDGLFMTLSLFLATVSGTDGRDGRGGVEIVAAFLVLTLEGEEMSIDLRAVVVDLLGGLGASSTSEPAKSPSSSSWSSSSYATLLRERLAGADLADVGWSSPSSEETTLVGRRAIVCGVDGRDEWGW